LVLRGRKVSFGRDEDQGIHLQGEDKLTLPRRRTIWVQTGRNDMEFVPVDLKSHCKRKTAAP